jgi:hypothetical protein
MKEKYGNKIDLKIFTLDSAEAQKYAFQFKGSTNVLLNNAWVPVDIAIDKDKMDNFITKYL